jgi:hypothetical protein
VTAADAPRQYRAYVVGYAEHDGGPRTYRVDITDTDGTPTEIASLTPDEARALAAELVDEAARADRLQAGDPSE